MPRCSMDSPGDFVCDRFQVQDFSLSCAFCLTLCWTPLYFCCLHDTKASGPAGVVKQKGLEKSTACLNSALWERFTVTKTVLSWDPIRFAFSTDSKPQWPNPNSWQALRKDRLCTVISDTTEPFASLLVPAAQGRLLLFLFCNKQLCLYLTKDKDIWLLPHKQLHQMQGERDVLSGWNSCPLQTFKDLKLTGCGGCRLTLHAGVNFVCSQVWLEVFSTGNCAQNWHCVVWGRTRWLV